MQQKSSSEIKDFSIPIQRLILFGFKNHLDRNALYINSEYFTYSDLFQRIAGIVDRLNKYTTVDSIGVYCNNDVETYCATIAVGIVGAAFVPLNTKFPNARNRKICEQSGLKLILSSSPILFLNEITTEAKVISISANSLSITNYSIDELLNITSKETYSNYKRIKLGVIFHFIY